MAEELYGVDIHRVDHLDVLHPVEHRADLLKLIFEIARFIFGKFFPSFDKRLAIGIQQLAGLVKPIVQHSHSCKFQSGFALSFGTESGVGLLGLGVAAGVPQHLAQSEGSSVVGGIGVGDAPKHCNSTFDVAILGKGVGLLHTLCHGGGGRETYSRNHRTAKCGVAASIYQTEYFHHSKLQNQGSTISHPRRPKD